MDAESVLSPEIHNVTLARDSISVISATLLPSTMFVLPASRAMVYPNHPLSAVRITTLNDSYGLTVLLVEFFMLMVVTAPLTMLAKRRDCDGKA